MLSIQNLLFSLYLNFSWASAHQVKGILAVASPPLTIHHAHGFELGLDNRLDASATLLDGVCIAPSIYDHSSIMETVSTMNVITVEHGGPQISSFAPKNPPIYQPPPPPPPPSRHSTLEIALFFLSIAPVVLGKNDNKPVAQIPTKPTTRKYLHNGKPLADSGALYFAIISALGAMEQLASFAPIFFGPNDGKPLSQIPPKPQPRPSNRALGGVMNAAELQITSQAMSTGSVVSEFFGLKGHRAPTSGVINGMPLVYSAALTTSL